MRVVVLTGGTGGVKLLMGLRFLVPETEIAVIVNTADNMYWNGLYVCPDVDTVVYALSGQLDLDKMWGVRNDTFNFIHQAQILGLEKTWFKIGDRDLAMHILRTYLMSRGYSLSSVVKYVCARLNIRARVIPMTDNHVETHVLTEMGDLHIQEFLVLHEAKLEPLGVKYVGIEQAEACPEAIHVLEKADLVIIGPSSPPVSILPIIYTRPIGEVLENIDAPRVAVSPLVGDRPVLGITDKFLKAIGCEPTVVGVAKLYRKYVTHMIIDKSDNCAVDKLRELGLVPITADIVMRDMEDAKRLAETILSIVHYCK